MITTKNKTLLNQTFKTLKPKKKLQKAETPPPTRPPTAKPKKPDEYEFENEQVAKDYRKMWEKMQAMEQLLAQQGLNKIENNDSEGED